MALKAYIEEDILQFEENLGRGNFSFDNKIPICQITVELSNGSKTKLDIFCDSDPHTLAKNFCDANRLSSICINYLSEQIAALQAISDRQKHYNVIEDVDEEDFSHPTKKKSNFQLYNNREYKHGIRIIVNNQEGTSSLNVSYKEASKKKEKKSYFSALTKPTEELENKSLTVPIKTVSEMISSDRTEKKKVAVNIKEKKPTGYVSAFGRGRPFECNLFHYDVINTAIKEQVIKTQKRYNNVINSARVEDRVFDRLYTAAIVKRTVPAKIKEVDQEEERVRPELSFTSGVKLGKRMYERGMKIKHDFALVMAKERFEKDKVERKIKRKVNKKHSFEKMSIFSVVY